jgi:predicted MFS family arabinose efflux permease
MRNAGDDVRLVPPRAAKLHRGVLLLLAAATGLSVANMYYVQPLLDTIGHQLHFSAGSTGLIVTVTQLGYAAGLMFLLPLGDLLERRRLVVVMAVGDAVALVLMARSTTIWSVLTCALAVGLLSVLAQILVPMAAALAGPDEGSSVVGMVMSGLLLGVLLARIVSGYLAQLGSWTTPYWAAAALMLTLATALRLGLPTDRHHANLTYPRLLHSTVALLWNEPVLRLRSVYGALGFAAFSVLWTSITFLLTGAPYHYSTGTVGLFGLVGAAGVAAASVAGRIGDHGGIRWTTAVTVLLLLISWLPLVFGVRSLAALLVGVVVLDLAVQGLHITNQSQIYRLNPEARSRLNSAYMTLYFVGGALGSALSTIAYADHGWPGVCVLGAIISAAAVAVWLGTVIRPQQNQTAAETSETSPGSSSSLGRAALCDGPSSARKATPSATTRTPVIFHAGISNLSSSNFVRRWRIAAGPRPPPRLHRDLRPVTTLTSPYPAQRPQGNPPGP